MSYQLLPVIWRRMSVEDIIRFSKTCKIFYSICQDDKNWKFLYERDHNEDSEGNDYFQKYINKFFLDFATTSRTIETIMKDQLYNIHNIIYFSPIGRKRKTLELKYDINHYNKIASISLKQITSTKISDSVLVDFMQKIIDSILQNQKFNSVKNDFTIIDVLVWTKGRLNLLLYRELYPDIMKN